MASTSPSSPLLPSPTSPPSRAAVGGGIGRLPSLRGAARFLRRTGSRRLMRKPSVAVRETAAEHLEERQIDWAYSKPVVVLDVLWNLVFVAAAAAVLAASLTESPAVPLRLWLVGYVLQCLLHVLCVAVEYRRRRREARAGGAGAEQDDGDLKIRIVDCFGKLIPGPETCLRELIPGAETSYEVEFFYGSHTSIDGPKKRRARAAEGAPKLFSGLYFCLSAYMNSEDREHIQNLIAAAEGQVLEGSSLHSLHENLDKNPVKLYFVYNCGPPRKFTANFSLDLRKEIEEGIEYAASGARAIGHLMVFNAIASF